jgi:hypothetical protein
VTLSKRRGVSCDAVNDVQQKPRCGDQFGHFAQRQGQWVSSSVAAGDPEVWTKVRSSVVSAVRQAGAVAAPMSRK